MKHCCILLLSVIVTGLFAQEAEPADPGIVLPPVLLEVEDLQVETVNAALPSDEDQLRPDVTIPLATAEDLYLPDAVFDIAYPDQIGVTPDPDDVSFSEYVQTSRTRAIFSDGRIGIGAPSYVLGDLSLYKIGGSPRFRLNFLHEKLDGYGFVQAGSGFYNSTDVLDGTISFEIDSFDFNIHGTIGESTMGLQDNVEGVIAYDSVTYRNIAGSIEVSHVTDPVTLTGLMRAEYFAQTLTAAEPQFAAEVSIWPRASATLFLDPFDFELDLQYELASTSSETGSAIEHRLFAALISGLRLQNLRLYLDAGFMWLVSDTILPDVRLGLEWNVRTMLRIETSGGYVSHPVRNSILLVDRPLLKLTNLGAEFGWEWKGAAQFRPVTPLLLSIDAGLSYLEGVPDSISAHDPETGLFDPIQEAIAMTRLEMGVGMEWTISNVIGLTVDWNGIFIERTQFEPSNEVTVSMAAEDPIEGFGALLQLGANIRQLESDPSPEISVPILNFGGYYRISESVRVQLDVHDALSWLISPGRIGWDPYIEPGLNVTLVTTISL